MNFDELTGFLEKRLRKSLPGEKAHRRMKPKMADGSPIRIKHTVPPRPGGVLILLYEDEGTVRFPLIQRPSYPGIHSGQMALPGGRFEETDEDQIATALRESEEEIGINRNQVEIIGSLSEFFVAASNYMVLPVVGKLHGTPQFIPEPREVADVVTPPVSQLINPDVIQHKEMEVRSGIRMFCPYYALEGRTVWGATAMILSEFEDILKEFSGVT